jgi:hypothetical protein
MRLKGITSGNRRWFVGAGTVFVSCLLLGSAAGSANAGIADSANGYYTVAGHQYVNTAIIDTGSDIAIAITDTSWSAGGTPTGDAGSRGRLFTSGGSLSCEGSNTYNSSTGSLAVGYSCDRYTSGTWYSYGVSLGWNGSGYTSFYTYQSPNQNS